MANHYSTQTSAEIEQAIEEDRRRIDKEINELQERLAPRHVIDALIAYAWSGGGSQYVRNLGQSVKNNPLPVALMGVSLAWLMAMPRTGPHERASDRSSRSHRDERSRKDYPLASVEGEVRRVGPAYEEEGAWYSQFVDAAGKRYKAISDKAGRRAGHFMDESGRMYRGFVDAGGRQIEHIRDETGNLLDEASGWASRTWQHAKDSVSHLGSQMSHTGSSTGHGSASAMKSLQAQSSHLNRLILNQFRDQPLVGGAIAFAVGAAIGATLPRTETEDGMMGEAADAVRDQVSSQTVGLMERGKDVVSDVYEKTVSAASEVRDAARDRLAEESRHFESGTRHFEGTEPPTPDTRPS